MFTRKREIAKARKGLSSVFRIFALSCFRVSLLSLLGGLTSGAEAQTQGTSADTALALIRAGDRALQQRDHAGIAAAATLWIQAATYLERSPDTQLYTRVLSNLGLVMRSLGNPDSALGFYRRALRVRQETGDGRGAAASLATMAGVFQDQGKLDSARTYLELGIGAWEIEDDLHGQGVTLDQLGQLHVVRGELDSAMQRYWEALSIFEEANDPDGQAQVLDHIGTVWLVRNRPDSALGYYRDALERVAAVNARARTGGILEHIARAHLALGARDSARAGFQEALALAEQFGDRRVQELAREGLARLETP